MAEKLTEKPHAETLPTAASAGVMLDGRYMPPPSDEDGKLWVRTTALIQSDPQKLYSLWRDVEKMPLWQEQISEVRSTGPKTSHWVMQSGDNRIEWDSEILTDEPGRRIAWRSVSGDSNNAGEIVFEPAPGNRGTMVTLLQEFRLGKLANMWETIVGRNPKQSVVENLRHFKALAETGEIPRTQGQPTGRRGIIGKMKESLYGEKIPTPPGTARKAS